MKIPKNATAKRQCVAPRKQRTAPAAALNSFGDGVLKPFTDSIWTATTPVRFVGTWFPHVMTVVRLKDGSVMLHSPCRPLPALLEVIAQIGPVAHVVAPNWFHDLYLREYRVVYPHATFWGPRFLQRQHPTIIDRAFSLGDAPPWVSELPYASLSGLLSFDEAVFFHVSTRTLIVADFLTNASADERAPMLTRLGYRFLRLNGRLQVFPVLRWFGFTSMSSMHCVASQIVDWNPERVIIGHGYPLTSDVPGPLHTALSWLLEKQ